MATESRSQVYERGLQLAEEGKHAEALEHICAHLTEHPADSQALNDAGVILFCQGRNEEAIEHLEKAKRTAKTSELAEINWNLCEVYLAAGYPGPAMRLFDEMEAQEILSADVLNRAANACLAKDMYGHAIELLLRSLELAPGQKILEPMTEVIRSKRPKVALFCREQSAGTDELFEFVGKRFVTEMHVGKNSYDIRPILDWCDIALFDGCCDGLVEISQVQAPCRMIVRLSCEEACSHSVEDIHWANIDILILADGRVGKEILFDRLGDLERQTEVVVLNRGVDIERLKFVDKPRGKKIACLDDLTSRTNPMFLLQCIQKLHYIDDDYRLYFAGKFDDPATEHYLRYMTEQLELSNVVFFDTAIRNEAAWLRDKHFITSAAITGGGIEGILKGMSCGLKPVVANFPGAGDMPGKEFVFNLSEDFCNLVLSDAYEPARYRRIVEKSHSQKVHLQAINDILFRTEKDIGQANTLTEPAKPDRYAEADVSACRRIPIRPTGPDSRDITPVNLPGTVLQREAELQQPDTLAGTPPLHRKTAAEHLSERIGSINRMSAEVLEDWKAFTEKTSQQEVEPTPSVQPPVPPVA